ncbi:MAG: hypothetical protein ACM3UY_03180 [Methanocella sp.]
MRLQTKNEYVGRLLETPILSSLDILKKNRCIVQYWANYPKPHNGDFDAVVEMHEGTYLDFEAMNLNPIYQYDETSWRVRNLTNQLDDARKTFGTVSKLVLISTDAVTAKSTWLKEHDIELLNIGKQVRVMDKAEYDEFVTFLAQELSSLIRKIGKNAYMGQLNRRVIP